MSIHIFNLWIWSRFINVFVTLRGYGSSTYLLAVRFVSATFRKFSGFRKPRSLSTSPTSVKGEWLNAPITEHGEFTSSLPSRRSSYKPISNVFKTVHPPTRGFVPISSVWRRCALIAVGSVAPSRTNVPASARPHESKQASVQDPVSMHRQLCEKHLRGIPAENNRADSV